MMEENWPYLLFLPADPHDLREFLMGVFGSPITFEILEKIDRGVLAQREIIRRLRHSNKTVIAHLKKLVKLKVLEECHRLERGRHTIWYKPTDIGRWILLMFKRQLPSLDLEKVLEELFKTYIDNIIDLCLKKNMEAGKLERIFSAAVTKALAKLQKAVFEPEVIVYGSASMETIALSRKANLVSGVGLLHEVYESPSGSGGNVAVALSRLGVRVSFAGKIGGDSCGWRMINDFIKENVDTTNLIIDRRLQTPRTIVIFEDGERKAYVTATARTALSISDPEEINWELIKNAKAVYIGETFVEVGELIASYAKTRNLKVFYRPTIHHLKRGVDKVEGILRNTDFLILSERGWSKMSKGKPESEMEILGTGLKTLIVFKGVTEGCDAYTKEGRIHVDGFDVDVLDASGSGDAFSAGFMKAVLDGKSLRESIRFGLAASAISVQRPGSRSSMPRLDEVIRLLGGGRDAKENNLR